MTRLFRRILTLRHDKRGAAAIELALIAPILATMVVGVVDLSRGYSMKLQLEQAAQRAIEKVMNGQANTSTAAALKTEAATVAGVAESAVAVDFWLECNGTRAGDYNTVCTPGQTYARFMSVAITKTFTPMFAKKWAGANTDGTYTIVGRTGVRIQ
ncbi:MAG: pilus assembly protein [Sphingomonas bacterium]|nr:pilus assembly protein [Sphingomonas bacterium]